LRFFLSYLIITFGNHTEFYIRGLSVMYLRIVCVGLLVCSMPCTDGITWHRIL